jgi:hypothetical protein
MTRIQHTVRVELDHQAKYVIILQQVWDLLRLAHLEHRREQHSARCLAIFFSHARDVAALIEKAATAAK